MAYERLPLEVFAGREAERARIAEVVNRAGTGQPWLVTVEGEPGIGKTTLIKNCLAGTSFVRVLQARADQAEAGLDFGLVDQLLRSAGAGSMVALLAGGAPASSFAVGAGLLQVVGELMTAGPVAIVVDDVQWADRPSIEALMFMLRRLSVDPLVAFVICREAAGYLDEAVRRLLASMENRLAITLRGLSMEEVGSLAATAAGGAVDERAVYRLYQGTGGHPLYLRTVLAEGAGFDLRDQERLVLPRSLAAAIGDQLQMLPPETRELLEMLAVLNVRLPLAQLAQAVQAGSPSAAIEPAVAVGLAAWAPDEPSCPVGLRHLLIRDAIYAGIPAASRRRLHARAALVVAESASWQHRVAALEHPDEDLAARLEHLADEEAASGRVALAATHLQWASDISADRAGLERRLLTAVMYLLQAEESRGLALRPVVEAAGPSPLRGCLLGAMAQFSGQIAEAERWFTEALTQARAEPDSRPLAATIAICLAGTYLLMGNGEKAGSFGRWALSTGCLDALTASQTRTQIALGALEVAGPTGGLAEVGHLDADPARIGPLDAECLAWRGTFRLLTGDLDGAVTDMTAGLRMVRKGAPLTLGLLPYGYLVLAQYLAGAWDDAVLTCEQAFSAATIRSRPYELPLLHLAATCIPAGRGQAEEAERHAQLAEKAAASLGYTEERVNAAIARALVAQAAGDYLGMADALGPFLNETALNSRSRNVAMLWRPLLGEGLLGSGQTEQAANVIDQLRESAAHVSYVQPVLAWLEGWLAEQRGAPQEALRVYGHGEDTASSQNPIGTARLLLAHGQLLRRTGDRKGAIERLRRASVLFAALRATPFTERAEQELAACNLPGHRASRQSVLELTNRETEVACLAGRGLRNSEIATELFISLKAVEYHLSNIYAKYGLHGRRQLQQLVAQWDEPVAI